MLNRNEFLKSSALGLGAMTLAPAFNQVFGSTALGSMSFGKAPKRFIFIRKSSGIRPLEIALKGFKDKDKVADDDKQRFLHPEHKHEQNP